MSQAVRTAIKEPSQGPMPVKIKGQQIATYNWQRRGDLRDHQFTLNVDADAWFAAHPEAGGQVTIRLPHSLGRPATSAAVTGGPAVTVSELKDASFAVTISKGHDAASNKFQSVIVIS